MIFPKCDRPSSTPTQKAHNCNIGPSDVRQNTNKSKDSDSVSEQLAALGKATVKVTLHRIAHCLHLLFNGAVSNSGYTVFNVTLVSE
jgi:hypothetical protein